jgi:hypothetical protein
MLQRAISVSIFHPNNRKERKKILQKIGLKKVINTEGDSEKMKILEDDEYNEYDINDNSYYEEECDGYDTKEECKFSAELGIYIYIYI